MRFDANISILFPDLSVAEGLERAVSSGFDAVEMWWPFDRDAPREVDVDRLVEAVQEHGVSLVSLNLTHGDRAKGEHGLAALPGQKARFLDSVDAAVEIAGRVGCKALNALFGNVPADISADSLVDTAIENLALAAARAATVGTQVVVEALNPVDFPLYGLHTIEEAAALVARVREGSGATIGLLFDVYHVQRAEGDITARFRSHVPDVVHVQIADSPDRLRPGTGEIAFRRVLAALEDAGYRGFVGLEYHPSVEPADTFAWLPHKLRRSGVSFPRSEH